MSDTFRIKKPRPLFRRHLRQAPAHPRGDRILVRELPPESVTEGNIQLADEGKERFMAGHLVAAGDQAADKLYDGGDEIGDLIMYAKYAGVVNEWQHIVGDDDLKCEHDGNRLIVPMPSATLDALRGGRDKEALANAKKWEIAGGPNDNVTLRECVECGTLIASERMIVMSVDDIHLNVDLQERIEAGEVARYRGITDDERTRFYIKRLKPRPECFGGPEPETDDENETLKEVA